MENSPSRNVMKKNRLYPSKNCGRYHILTQIRLNIEQAIARHLANTHINTLVDYGCGSMPYKELFLPIVDNYIGVDVQENTKADIHLNSSGSIPLGNETCDIVLSTQVLEHVHSIEKYLGEVYRILTPDGFFFLSTHGFWQYHPEPVDLWRWTKEGLQKDIKENHFNIIEAVTIMGLTASGLQLFQDGFCRKLPKFLVKPFYRTIQLMQKHLDDYNRSAYDGSVFPIIGQEEQHD